MTFSNIFKKPGINKNDALVEYFRHLSTQTLIYKDTSFFDLVVKAEISYLNEKGGFVACL